MSSVELHSTILADDVTTVADEQSLVLADARNLLVVTTISIVEGVVDLVSISRTVIFVFVFPVRNVPGTTKGHDGSDAVDGAGVQLAGGAVDDGGALVEAAEDDARVGALLDGLFDELGHLLDGLVVGAGRLEVGLHVGGVVEALNGNLAVAVLFLEELGKGDAGDPALVGGYGLAVFSQVRFG